MSTNQWKIRALLCLRLAAIVGAAAIIGLIHFVITQLFTLYLIYSALLGLPLGYLIAMFGPDCANRRQFARLLCFTFLCSVVVLFVSNIAYFQQFYADTSTHAQSAQLGLPSNVFEYILFRIQHESRSIFSIDLSSLQGIAETAFDVYQGGSTSSGVFSNAFYMVFELVLLWFFVSIIPLHRLYIALKTGVPYDTVMFTRNLMRTATTTSQIHEQLRKRGITTNDEIARAIQAVRIYEAQRAQVHNGFLKDLFWR